MADPDPDSEKNSDPDPEKNPDPKHCPFKVKMKLSVFNRVSFKHQDTDIFIALTYPDQGSK